MNEHQNNTLKGNRYLQNNSIQFRQNQKNGTTNNKKPLL